MKKIEVDPYGFLSSVKVFLIVLTLGFLVIIGCSTPTAPKGNLTGLISIEGLADYSGATVSIYRTVAIDTAFVRLNAAFTTLGVRATQQTEFDIREQTPFKTTFTNSDGSFSISDLSEGTYNVVVKKNGYGFKIFYNFDITTGSNNLNTASENDLIVLYPETTLSGLITDDMTLLSDHHYITSGETYFAQNTSLIIQPGVYVRIAPGATLHFQGSVSMQGTVPSLLTEGNLIHFTSNDGISGAKGESKAGRLVQNYNKVAFEPTSTIVSDLVEGCIFTYGNYGLASSVSCNLKYTVFRTSVSSFQATQIESVSIENCIFQNALSGQAAVELSSINSLSCLKNIFYDNSIGMYIKITDTGLVKNNYFENCDKGIKVEYYSYPEITKNTITGGATGMTVHQESTPNIHHNQINATIGILCDGFNGNAPITLNNFKCTVFAVKYYCTSTGTLSAINNYWGVTTAELISEIIFDQDDMSPGMPDYDSYSTVVYSPFRTTSVSTAGVEH